MVKRYASPHTSPLVWGAVLGAAAAVREEATRRYALVGAAGMAEAVRGSVGWEPRGVLATVCSSSVGGAEVAVADGGRRGCCTHWVGARHVGCTGAVAGGGGVRRMLEVVADCFVVCCGRQVEQDEKFSKSKFDLF